MTDRNLGSRLQPLITRAERQQDEIARGLATQQSQLQTQQQRMTELRHYVQEYTHRSGGSVLPALIANRFAFVERLEMAVSQQQIVLENREANCNKQRLRFIEANRDTEVLEKLAARCRAALHEESCRREQREVDDLAARRRVAGLGDE